MKDAFLGLLVLLIIIGCSLDRQPLEKSMADAPQSLSMKEQLVSALNTYTQADFVEVDTFEDIVNDAYFESRHWMTMVFGEAHDPHNEAHASKHSYHLWHGEQPGFDLLRHEYALQSRSIVVTESVSMIHIVVGLQDDERQRQADPTVLASELGTWLLNQLVTFKEDREPWLSSNPDIDEDKVKDWKNRIDAMVDNDRLLFIIYKMDPMTSAAPRNLTVWFDEEFREDPPRKATK